MAAAIIPLIATAIGAIGPQLPSIIQAVEGIFGHSSSTGKQDGAAKLPAAVDMAMSLLQALANAGKIPSAPVVDPSLPAGLAGAIQAVVDQLNAAGKLGAAAGPVVLPAPPSTSTASASPTNGRTVTITGILYGA